MIQVRCPICGKVAEIAGIGDLPTFPFCSERCQLIDLGRWIDEGYAVPDDVPPPDPPDPAAEEGE
jgi:endogenous inhibitor of DNA gyrase (YacG/DUF329 family)